jgi:hypothetical protein
MENRIKEKQFGLLGDRTSRHECWVNQFRLLLFSLAYLLIEACAGFVPGPRCRPLGMLLALYRNPLSGYEHYPIAGKIH